MRRVWKSVSSRHGRVVLSAVLLVAVGVAVLNIDRRTPRERATAWAASHRDRLPATLEALAAYPMDYQKAIVKAMPAADKSRLWRAHLQTMLDRETLTDKQRALINDTIVKVTPASFEGANPPEICNDIIAAFPDFRQRKMMVTLASMAEPATVAHASWVTFAERVRSSVTVHARAKECNCRGLGICECAFLEGCDQEQCTPSPDDCGCIWSGPCDKLCMVILDLRAPSPTPTTTKTQ
jgi:hypothetical protein